MWKDAVEEEDLKTDEEADEAAQHKSENSQCGSPVGIIEYGWKNRAVWMGSPVLIAHFNL